MCFDYWMICALSLSLYLRASDAAWRCGAETGISDDVTSSLRLWFWFPSPVLSVLRGLRAGQPPGRSRAGKCTNTGSHALCRLFLKKDSNKDRNGNWLEQHDMIIMWPSLNTTFLLMQVEKWPDCELFYRCCTCIYSLLRIVFCLFYCLLVKERARFSFLGRSDGPLSTASLRPDLLLPVPKPAAIFVGLRDLGEHQLLSRPRAV